MKINEKVVYSPIGAGQITGFSERGYPQVNWVTVSWLIMENGEIYNPHNIQIEIKNE